MRRLGKMRRWRPKRLAVFDPSGRLLADLAAARRRGATSRCHAVDAKDVADAAAPRCWSLPLVAGDLGPPPPTDRRAGSSVTARTPRASRVRPRRPARRACCSRRCRSRRLDAIAHADPTSPDVDLARARGLIATSLVDLDRCRATETLLAVAEGFTANDCIVWWRDGAQMTPTAARASPTTRYRTQIAGAARIAAAAAGTVITAGPQAALGDRGRAALGPDGGRRARRDRLRCRAPVLGGRAHRSQGDRGAAHARAVVAVEPSPARRRGRAPARDEPARSADRRDDARRVRADDRARGRGRGAAQREADARGVRRRRAAPDQPRSTATRPATRCSRRSPSRIRATVRGNDPIGRLGGDEIAVLLVGATDDQAALVVRKLIHKVADRADQDRRVDRDLGPGARGRRARSRPASAAARPRSRAATRRCARRRSATSAIVASDERTDATADAGADTGSLSAGTIVGGTYRVVHELSRGAMGVVYRGEDLGLGRAGRDQGAALRPRERSRSGLAVPRRGRHPRVAAPPEPRAGLRARRARRRRLLRDGARRGPAALRGAARDARAQGVVPDRRGRADHARDRRRARRDARARPHPPRRQAGEHPARSRARSRGARRRRRRGEGRRSARRRRHAGLRRARVVPRARPTGRRPTSTASPRRCTACSPAGRRSARGPRRRSCSASSTIRSRRRRSCGRRCPRPSTPCSRRRSTPIAEEALDVGVDVRDRARPRARAPARRITRPPTPRRPPKSSRCPTRSAARADRCCSRRRRSSDAGSPSLPSQRIVVGQVRAAHLRVLSQLLQHHLGECGMAKHGRTRSPQLAHGARADARAARVDRSRRSRRRARPRARACAEPARPAQGRPRHDERDVRAPVRCRSGIAARRDRARRAADVLGSLSRLGRRSPSTSSRSSADVVLDGYPGSTEVCALVGAELERIVELTGASAVGAAHIACACTGDARCEYRLSWTTPTRSPVISVDIERRMRTPFVVGNWKLNKTIAEALALVTELKNQLGAVKGVAVGVAPTFIALHAVAKRLEGSPIATCAQDCFWETVGRVDRRGLARRCSPTPARPGRSSVTASAASSSATPTRASARRRARRSPPGSARSSASARRSRSATAAARSRSSTSSSRAGSADIDARGRRQARHRVRAGVGDRHRPHRDARRRRRKSTRTSASASPSGSAPLPRTRSGSSTAARSSRATRRL